MHPTVSVAVRVRPAEPANETEEWIIQENVIYGVRPENQRKVFAFDHIISQTGTNAEVYDRVVYPILNSVIAGYNGTVLAYGQTCPGKRHMTDKDGDPSVIRRAIIGIFDEIDKEPTREFLLRVSSLEIRNEEIRDLLRNSTCANLSIENPGMNTTDLAEEIATSPARILQFLTASDNNRVANSFELSEKSAESDFIFRITIESMDQMSGYTAKKDVRLSELNFVDIGHHEPFMAALGTVVREISFGGKGINGSDSKVMRILQDSIGGNSFTTFICNISASNFESSLSSLRFASQAKRIKNTPVINRVSTEDASMLRKRDKDIAALEELISKVNAGEEQEFEEKRDTINQLRKKIADLRKTSIRGGSVLIEDDLNEIEDDEIESDDDDETRPAGEIPETLRHVLQFEDGVKTLREPFRSLWNKLKSFYRTDWIKVENHRDVGRKFLLLRGGELHPGRLSDLMMTAFKFLRGVAARPDCRKTLHKPSKGLDESYAKLLSMMAASCDITNKLAETLRSRPLVVEQLPDGYRYRCLLCPRLTRCCPVSIESAHKKAMMHCIVKHRRPDCTSAPLVRFTSNKDQERVVEFDEFFRQIQAAVSNHAKLQMGLGLQGNEVWYVSQG